MSAIEKLQPQVVSDQRETLGETLALDTLALTATDGQTLELVSRVTGGDIERTIDAASTVTVTVHDGDRAVEGSGLLADHTTITLDGLDFELVGVSGKGDELTLTFEDYEVAALRRFNAKLKRGVDELGGQKYARVRFAALMVNEARLGYTDRPGIPGMAFVCPLLEKAPPITSKATQPTITVQQAKRAQGFAPGVRLTVKGRVATPTQLDNARTIVDVGLSVGNAAGASAAVIHKAIVIAFMVATQESSITNLGQPKVGAYNHRSSDPRQNPVGVFQQIAYFGWPASGDVAKDAHAFFAGPSSSRGGLYAAIKAGPGFAYEEVADAVQVSGLPELYAQWRTEAERWAKAAGATESDSAALAANATATDAYDATDTTNQFTRGTPVRKGNRTLWKPENSWDCLGRLADEVNWRRFMVSRTLYLISEPDLVKSAPRMRLSRASVGVDAIDYDYDTGKQGATVTVTCRIGQWLAPPGSTVELFDVGHLNGRWLVATIRRSLFDTAGEITLKKPRPVLLEANAPEYQQTDELFGLKTPPKRPPKPAGPGGIEVGSGARADIVRVARLALAEQQRQPYTYGHARPFNFDLFSPTAHAGIDCSAFVIMVYRTAGAPDPSGHDHSGFGYTGDLADHGIATSSPQAGDVVLWGNPYSQDGAHTGIYIGGGQTIEMGVHGIATMPVSYMTLYGYRSYQ